MFKNLLTIDNAKTIKGQKLGFITGILYMAPAKISGFQVCPLSAIAQCEDACLYRAGLGGVYTSVQNARIAKAQAFFSDRAGFMRDVVFSIAQLIRRGMLEGAIPLVRLNGTSDIRYESVPVTIDPELSLMVSKVCGFDIEPGHYSNVMAVFPEIQFYDYTKIPNRRDIPSNYDLTFSFSGVVSFQRYVKTAIESGMRIAVVFRRREDIPSHFLGMECVDGDDTDIRHLDPRGVVVALYAKGPARKDSTGFVVDTPRRVIPVFAAA